MALDSTSLHDLTFVADGLDAGIARVRRVSAREGISLPYEIDVDLDIPRLIQVEPRAWLLKGAAVAVYHAGDGAVVRRLSGLVTRVRERGTRGEKQRVGVTLESPLAKLRLVTDFRIFQSKNSKQIVTTLLEDAGVPSDAVAWRLGGDPPEREVCTQAGETSFAFASRILEEDGIFYFFEHGEDGAKVVFGDASSAYAKVTPNDEISFIEKSALVSSEAVTEIVEIDHARPAKVTLRDHDFKRPVLDLEAKAEGETALGREHYDYPGRYTDPGQGKKRAQARLDAMTAASTGARGKSTVFSLIPGHTFTLAGAKNAELDQAWVIVDLETTWDDTVGATHFHNNFRVIPKNTPFRPLPRAPRAVMAGPHLAIVTGPPGEEIHPDEHGRVKVYFPWDRRSSKDDKSSFWVRVGQMHTSGSVAIPRIGWEVIVDFEDGDPDKPIILGRLYNGKYGTPYPLPGQKTVSSLQSRSSPGGTGRNEIRMDDGSGSEVMNVHAQKDMNVNVANNKTEKVTTNSSLAVGSNHTVSVGANETLKVGAKYQIAIGSNQTLSVGASRTKTITGDEKITVNGDRSMTIGASHTTMTPKSVSASTPASFTETVGGSCIEAAALGAGMAVAGATSVSVGGVKIEAAAGGKSDFTIGAHANTVGGAFIAASGKDVGVSVGGAKATTVGGAWMANAGGDVELSSDGNLNITVGGAVALNAASITFKVGGSTVTVASGGVSIKTTSIKLTATGPQPELAPMVEDK